VTLRTTGYFVIVCKQPCPDLMYCVDIGVR